MGATESSSLIQTRTPATWVWKSGDNPWSETDDSWCQYTDPEIYMIEDAYQKKKSIVEIEDYWLDLKNLVQINKNDTNKQRPIKRIEVGDKSSRVRASQRFVFHETQITKKSFSPVGIWGWSKFLAAAGFRARISDTELSSRVEAAAQGILEEGKILNREKDAEWMARILLASKNKRANEIGEVCVRLYTMESFLYRLINQVMRDAVIEKKEGTNDAYEFVFERDRIYGKNLGPYCSLLLGYLWQHLTHREVTVYRAARLEPAMIDDYQQHLGEFVEWDGFSSTTTSFNHAKSLETNVIFRIKIPCGPHPSVDIQRLSEFPNEEEILLPAGTWVKIEKVTRDETLGVIIIDMIK
ncbi:unnamed protein product [Rotaria sp. Silwood2]|nr:unnamed protein product [Rotaria sp. Silwood2]CAF4213344.1 unnamed protein product [Rotaria sp. Silwood2]